MREKWRKATFSNENRILSWMDQLVSIIEQSRLGQIDFQFISTKMNSNRSQNIAKQIIQVCKKLVK